MQLNSKDGQVYIIKQVKRSVVDVIKKANDSQVINYGSESIEIEGLESLIYNSLKTKLGVNFEVSETTVNWLFKPENRLFRLFITDKLYTKETLENTDFGILLLQMITYFKPFVINVDGTSVVYLQEIYPIHYSILNLYLGNNSIVLEQLVDGKVEKITELK